METMANDDKYYREMARSGIYKDRQAGDVLCFVFGAVTSIIHRQMLAVIIYCRSK